VVKIMRDNRLFDIPANQKVIDIQSILRNTHPVRSLNSEISLNPLEMLVFAILSQRTTHADAERAFSNVLTTFQDWKAVADAPPRFLERQVRMTSWPEVKVARVQAALRNVEYYRGGRLDLENLNALDNDDAMSWLVRLPGVRFKTGACVLLMSTMHRRVLPVDTGHRRVMIRFGMMSRKVGWDEAHPFLLRLLPNRWDATEVEVYHDVVKRHAQSTCTAHSPACDRCPLINLCLYGRRRLQGLNVADPVQAPGRRPNFGHGQLSLHFD
jgi:endonuclease-3